MCGVKPGQTVEDRTHIEFMDMVPGTDMKWPMPTVSRAVLYRREHSHASHTKKICSLGPLDKRSVPGALSAETDDCMLLYAEQVFSTKSTRFRPGFLRENGGRSLGV